jgi:aminoglycoside phosphotransferase (APT) family kinase protein
MRSSTDFVIICKYLGLRLLLSSMASRYMCMRKILFDSIPADRRETARSALTAAFGPAPLTAVQRVTSGASALIYRIEVADRPYLLRLESFQRDEIRDPERAYRCMRTAVEAGIAPALHHADPTAGVAIMDFVPGRSLSEYAGGPQGLARDLGGLVARLQATPAFPPVTDYLSVLESLLGRLLGSGLFASGLLDRHQEGFERIRQAYPWDSRALVSSHNDPHPDNILFDGERLWLIDWETAYRNDPLVDVAIFTLYLAASPELEGVLLQSWLGRAPDRALRARLVLMRQLVRLFYACASSLHAASPSAVPETDLAALTPAEFRAAVDERRLVLGAPETQRIGGKVALATFLAVLATPKFEEALIVAQQG